MVGDLPRRLVAEAIGTMLLVLFGAGSIVAALVVGRGTLNYAGLGIISLSFAVAVAVAVFAFGTTSGAHINPAVTVALAAGRRFPWSEVPSYIVAQLIGGFVGALLIVGGFGGRAVRLGGVGLTQLQPGVNPWQGLLFEALGTFLLLLTIMALAVDRRAPTGWAGLMIGLAVAGEIFVLGPLTNGSVNPARTFGPYLANALFGGSTPWAQLGVYIAGPVIGAVVAVVVYDFVARPERELPAGAEQGLAGEITGAREPGGEVPAGVEQGTMGPILGERGPRPESVEGREGTAAEGTVPGGTVPEARRPHEEELRGHAAHGGWRRPWRHGPGR
ncbi:MIP/aquaporin family protein [Nonomuraea pusilla]|uniref:Glycerol uptake facilitator protein n=1 Tax=Nonomuraea pusilla TaxID=46177 RepID=A0A1H7I955_9ACTN|nr:MIP/aquaporin family protein [Nonomuraea pusilla]SEK58287.1 glycerol uptake facilitator protein [Nonomuraea pusilla]